MKLKYFYNFASVADENVIQDNGQMLPLVMNWVRSQMASAKITIDRLTEDVSRDYQFYWADSFTPDGYSQPSL